MKVVFVNAPVVRSKSSSAENDFRTDGPLIPRWMDRFRLLRNAHALVSRSLLGGEIRYGFRAGSRWPFTLDRPTSYAPFPFFMAYAAAGLKEKGVDVTILDAIALREYSYDRFLSRIKEENADIVVVECSTPTIDIDLWFANKVAEFGEVALAGPHLNAETVAELMPENPAISYFLIGEYILSVLDLVNERRKGVYESRILKDLDSFSFPFRDYPGATNYYDPSMPTAKPQLQVYGSKGCPFKCTFCAWPQNMYFGNVAKRSPGSIAREIREAVEKQGYKSIFFDDDTFNLGNKRIAEICDELKDIGLPWTMMGRLDCSPPWVYDKMVESGCVGMRFGIESFNLDVLARVKKGIERKDFKAILEHITYTHPQLMIHLTMMKDMPGMTEEIHDNDMKILHDMGYSTDNIFRSYQLSHCAPFPGTELYREMQELIPVEELNDYKNYDGGLSTVMKS